MSTTKTSPKRKAPEVVTGKSKKQMNVVDQKRAMSVATHIMNSGHLDDFEDALGEDITRLSEELYETDLGDFDDFTECFKDTISNFNFKEYIIETLLDADNQAYIETPTVVDYEKKLKRTCTEMQATMSDYCTNKISVGLIQELGGNKNVIPVVATILENAFKDIMMKWLPEIKEELDGYRENDGEDIDEE